MVIDDTTKKKIVEVFKAVYETTEDAKSYTDAAKNLKSDLAKFLKVKTSVVNVAYSEWLKRQKNPDVMNSSDEILEAIE